MKSLLSILLLSCTVTSCFPLIFTAATASTFATAKDRSLGSTVDDIAISSRLKKELIKKGFKKIYAKINTEVVQGRVMLTGMLESEEEIMQVVEVAWLVPQVKEVINELKVNENSNHFNATQYAQDSWITSRIKASLFFHRQIKFVNYNIVTLNKEVYIFGIARTQEELDEVNRIAAKVQGVEKVISHVHLREDNISPEIIQSDVPSAE